MSNESAVWVELAAPRVSSMRSGRLTTNLVASMANFGVSVVVGIWFVPYLVHHLGMASYGIVPLASTLTSFLAIITVGLNTAVGRHLTVAMESGEDAVANRIFNTSLVGNLIIVALLLGPGVWTACNIERFLDVPPGRVAEVHGLFLTVVLSFLINQIKTTFDVSSYCRNRFDLRSLVGAIEQIVRVGAVVLLFRLIAPRIWYVGAGVVLASLISAAAALILWRRLTPNLRIDPLDCDGRALRTLASTGGWVMVSQVGTLLFLQIDLVVVNRLFGVYEGGHYAAALQWSALLRGLASTMGAVFAPTLMSLYARGDIDGLVRYARMSVRLIGLMMALPAGLICGLSGPVLRVWLGSEYVVLAPLMALMVVHLGFNLGYLPLHGIALAANRVRVPGIAQLVFGLANLGLALLLAGVLGWGLYGVAMAGALILTCRNLFFTSLYSSHILNRGRLTFLRETVPIGFATILLFALSGWLASWWQIRSYGDLLIAGALLSLVYLVGVYSCLLSPGERQFVLRLVSRKRLGQMEDRLTETGLGG